MKFIKTYQQLNESMSDTLYHFTHHGPLTNMLNDNTINLTLAVGSKSDFEINKRKFYFFSMQTSRNAGYGLRRNLPVMLVMDSAKLNKNFKGGPVNYWNMPGLDNKHRHEADEFEQRLVADKAEIPFDKYVKEIHFLLTAWDDEKSQKSLREMASHAKRKAAELGVPIYFYDDKVAYFNNAKGRAVEVDTNIGDPEADGYSDRDWGSFDILGVIVGADKKAQEEMADRVLASRLYHKESWMDKSDKEKKELIMKGFDDFAYKWRLEPQYISDFWLNDMYRSVESTVHNSRSTRNKFMKWVFVQLTKDMRKTGASDFKDYIKKKYGNF